MGNLKIVLTDFRKSILKKQLKAQKSRVPKDAQSNLIYTRLRLETLKMSIDKTK